MKGIKNMKITYVDEKNAILAAEELCKLLGSDWKPRVWHNGVWCYEAVYKGVIHVYPHVKGTFFCLIGECGMSAILAPEGVPHLSDPAEVVRLTVEGYKNKWLAFKREQEAFIQAGEECLGGGSTPFGAGTVKCPQCKKRTQKNHKKLLPG